MSAYLTKTRARFLGTAEIARPFDSSEMKCQAVAQETLGKAMCCLLECNCNGRGEGPDRDHLEQGSQIVDSSDPGLFLNEALRAPKSRCQREKDTSADAAMARNAPAGNVTGRLATLGVPQTQSTIVIGTVMMTCRRGPLWPATPKRRARAPLAAVRSALADSGAHVVKPAGRGQDGRCPVTVIRSHRKPRIAPSLERS
jgi:hypothetical protein